MSEGVLPRGLYAELPAVFEEDGAVDWLGFGRLLERCAGTPVGGMLVGGPLSERSALSVRELSGLLEDACAAAGRGRAVVFAVRPDEGEAALGECAAAREAGASAILVCGGGLPLSVNCRFLRALKRDCPLPVLLAAKRPARVLSSLCADETPDGLCECEPALPQILLCAEAARESGVRYLAGRGEEFCFLRGSAAPDLLFSPLFLLFPTEISRLFSRPDGLYGAKRRALLSLLARFRRPEGAAAFKWALSALGVCRPFVRLPLDLPDAAERAAVEASAAAIVRGPSFFP